MKKIIFMFFILFVVSPIFAGENIEPQPENQIVVALSGSACRDFCRDELNQCKRNCNLLRSSSGSDLLVNGCVENCMDDYDRCIRKCD